MTALTELSAKWESKRCEHKRLGSLVSMEAVCAEILADLTAIAQSHDDVLTLQQAHVIGGFSVDHLQRLVRLGKIENVGRKGSPRIRRGDVPVRAGHSLPSVAADGQLAPRRRMALAVITSQAGGD